MTNRIERRLLPVAALALATTYSAACHHADSILLVEVAGDLKLAPASFAVTVTPGQTIGKTIRVASATAAAVSLPASFTIQLPGTVTGPVTVAVDAYDAGGSLIAQGAATQQDLDVGGQTILVVTLQATGSISVIHPPDAGQPPFDAGLRTDAHPDAGTRDAAADAPVPTDAAGHPDAAPRADAALDGGADGGARS